MMTSARIVMPGQAMATIPMMRASTPIRIREVEVDLNIGAILSLEAEGHPDQDVGQRLPDLRVGVDEVPLDVAADDGRVGPVDLVVVEGLLGLRRDAGAVVGQAED